MSPEMGPPETTAWEYPFPDKSWALEFDNFITSIEQSQRPIGDIEDAVAMHRIIEKIYNGRRA
jgi:hypothetical protein